MKIILKLTFPNKNLLTLVEYSEESYEIIHLCYVMEGFYNIRRQLKYNNYDAAMEVFCTFTELYDEKTISL